jgi:PAS domain S-box-containing protein
MQFSSAEEQKLFQAEKRISLIRAVVIVFSTATFFFLDNAYMHRSLAYVLIALTWTYGAIVLYYKPYERYPIFLAAWFTYVSDAIFTTLWLYATGGFYSPYHVIYYASVIAVGFRFGLKTTLFTALLYAVCYFALMWLVGHVKGNETVILVRAGYFVIIGWLTCQITLETLVQARQKFMMKSLMEEAQHNHNRLARQQEKLNRLNHELQVRNNLFSQAEENAMIGSFAYYASTASLHFSDNLFRLFGYDAGAFVPSVERYFKDVHPEDLDKVKTLFAASIEGRENLSGVHRAVRKDGETRQFRVNCRWLRDGGREVLLGTVQDITGDVDMHAAIRQKNAELERTNQELSSFNYVASHDLREPIRKIITFSELALERKDGPADGRLANYLDRISAAGRRMQHLIEAFLNYSSIASVPAGKERVDLNQVIREVHQELAELHKGREIILTSDELPAVPGNFFQLKQLYFHLLDNAVKYCKPGECPKIRISLARAADDDLNRLGFLPEDEEYWKISISDQGIGFDQQYSERIFGVFQRLHAKDTYEGTGMGLALCRKVAHNHGGFIEAYGRSGSGATFVLYLPQGVRRESFRPVAGVERH